jgi:prephenate dehydrogenase
VSGFERIAVVGVGMMGATLARAVRSAGLQAEIQGYDVRRPPSSTSCGIEHWADSVEEACREADLVVLATPVAVILDLLPKLSRICPPGALVTDTGSTKAAIYAAARTAFTREGGPYFIGGHPMAGRERRGAEASDPDLLRRAPYALCADASVPSTTKRQLEEWVRALGAHPVWIEPEEHDRIAARVSHMPQLAVVALGSLLDNAADTDGRIADLAGSALRDLLRIASSPYPLWDDICRTNVRELESALTDLAAQLQALAGDLGRGATLERWFEAARHFREQRLRERP